MSLTSLALSVPFLPSLSGLPADEAAGILKENGAHVTLECVNWPQEYPYQPEVNIDIAHDGKSIFVNYKVNGMSLRAVNGEYNSHVHEDSCVEFFVAPEGRAPYFNFEFNCIGTPHVARRLDRHNGEQLSADLLSTIKRYSSVGTDTFEEKEGEYTWNLLVEIPLTILGVEYKGSPVELMGNFYKCADFTSHPHFLSWAPISTPTPDFHRPEFFAPITLE